MDRPGFHYASLYCVASVVASSSTRTFCRALELPFQLKVHLQASWARAWLVPGIVSSEPAAAPPPERISPSFLSFELGLFQNPSSESACLSLPEILQSSLSLQLGSLQPSLLRGCSRVGIQERILQRSWALSLSVSGMSHQKLQPHHHLTEHLAKLPELSLACSKLRNQNVQLHHHQKCMSQSFSGLELGSFQERFVGFRSLVVFAKQHFAKLAVPSAWSVPGTLRRKPRQLQACQPVLGACQQMLSIAWPVSQNGHL